MTAATAVVYPMTKLLMKRVEERARKNDRVAKLRHVHMHRHGQVNGESQGKWPKHGGSSMYPILGGMRANIWRPCLWLIYGEDTERYWKCVYISDSFQIAYYTSCNLAIHAAPMFSLWLSFRWRLCWGTLQAGIRLKPWSPFWQSCNLLSAVCQRNMVSFKSWHFSIQVHLISQMLYVYLYLLDIYLYRIPIHLGELWSKC